MKSLFEEMGGTYRQEGDYFIPNLTLPNDGDYKIGKYGRMRLDHLKKHRKILYTNYVTEGTLSKHLSEIDQACNARMEIIVPAMAKQEGATEELKASDQIEWVRRMNGTVVSMILCPIIAHNKGRSAVGWFFGGFFLGGIGLIIVSCLSSKK